MHMNENEEEAYEQESRQVWRTLLALCCKQLGYSDLEVAKVSWTIEREAAIMVLRSICREYNDNDWPADLNLSDIIDKHVYKHLR